MNDPSRHAPLRPRTERLLETLLAHRSEFVRFLEKMVGNVVAEDLLQEALHRASTRFDDLRQDEAVVGWFYRVLENAIIDHHRRSATLAKALERLAAELEPSVEPVERAPRPCRCVAKLADELKPEYAEALRRVEIDELPVKAFAEEAGISASNAGVRVFRARDALRKRVHATCGACAANGCLDCSCGA